MMCWQQDKILNITRPLILQWVVDYPLLLKRHSTKCHLWHEQSLQILNLTKECICTLCELSSSYQERPRLWTAAATLSLCDVAGKPELCYWSDFHYKVISSQPDVSTFTSWPSPKRKWECDECWIKIYHINLPSRISAFRQEGCLFYFAFLFMTDKS